MISGEAVPSTLIELVRRLTEHEVTPGSFLTTRSTLAEHAAQLMPVTLYCSDKIFTAFCNMIEFIIYGLTSFNVIRVQYQALHGKVYL